MPCSARTAPSDGRVLERIDERRCARRCARASARRRGAAHDRSRACALVEADAIARRSRARLHEPLVAGVRVLALLVHVDERPAFLGGEVAVAATGDQQVGALLGEESADDGRRDVLDEADVGTEDRADLLLVLVRRTSWCRPPGSRCRGRAARAPSTSSSRRRSTAPPSCRAAPRRAASASASSRLAARDDRLDALAHAGGLGRGGLERVGDGAQRASGLGGAEERHLDGRACPSAAAAPAATLMSARLHTTRREPWPGARSGSPRSARCR